MKFQDLPIRRKLLIIIALATGLGLGLNLLMQLTFSLRSSRAAMQSQSVSLAQIVATNSAAAIRFDDAQAATDILSGLRARPEITSAALRRPDGELFASYRMNSLSTPSAMPIGSAPRVDGGFWDAWMRVDYPVWQDGERLGNLTLQIDLSEMWRRIYQSIALAGATTGLAFLVAFALAARLQRSITRPMVRLADAAQAVGADKDYTRRVEIAQSDEVGHLANCFNAMLGELQIRDRELLLHRNNLEHVVEERTNELRKAKELAEMASKAKTRFLANMSHELRTPLNAVIGAAQLMKAGEDDAQQRDELVGAIQRSGLNLLGLIDSILDLSRIEVGGLKLSPQDFHLVECLDGVMATAAVSSRAKGLQLACIVAADVQVWRHGDARRLRQVLLTLLGNAVKFTERGEIVVRVRLGGSPDELLVSVSDTGIGIADAALNNVFEQFRQADDGADRRYPGSGLGLAIVHQVVTAMGGHVEVRSELGRGACFEFALPLPIAIEVAPEPPPMNLRVAYFEPHAAGAEALHSILLRIGCNPTRCGTVDELRRWASQARDASIPSWFLICTDSPQAQELLEQACELLDPKRVIGMSSVEVYEAKVGRQRFNLPLNVIKPVSRAALVSRFARDSTAGEAKETQTQPASPMAQDALRAPAPAHVLVVEDDLLNQTIVSRLLTHAGFRVSAVSSGASAIDAMRKESFDLVLMDWQMPDMDGLEVTRRLRSGAAGPAGRSVAIVALTANAFAEDREACLAAGMNDFLSKPVLVKNLLETLGRWIKPKPLDEADAQVSVATAADTAPVFDASVLATLPMVADGTQPGYADEVLGMFIDAMPSTLEKIRQAVSAGDSKSLLRVVHTLKSSSATVGALALAALAKEEETRLRNDLGAPPNLAEQLQSAFDQLMSALGKTAVAKPATKEAAS